MTCCLRFLRLFGASDYAELDEDVLDGHVSEGHQGRSSSDDPLTTRTRRTSRRRPQHSRDRSASTGGSGAIVSMKSHKGVDSFRQHVAQLVATAGFNDEFYVRC
jgi:hypothetical protein